MTKIQASKALSRFRVIDLSRVRAGPTCVRILADFGADVIRVEPPPGVDPNENSGGDRLGSDFQNLNRNKRSLTLNLKTPEGLEIVRRLVKDADVVVENWRPDVKQRLGLSYEQLREINPRIILASISGYGQDGPYAMRPGFDQVIQGMSGLMSVTGHRGQGPVRTGLAIADTGSGMNAAIGVLVALLERERSGQGQWVHTSLLHSLVAMMDFQAARHLNEGDVPVQEGNDHPTCSPMGLFRAADGLFNLGVAGEGIWASFCRVCGKPEWIDDERFRTNRLRIENRRVLTEEMEWVLRERPVAHWVEALNRAGIPAGPVHTVPEVFDDAQVQHLGLTKTITVAGEQTRTLLMQPMRLERTPPDIASGAPACGEHTEEILREAGYDEAAIADFRSKRIV